MRMEDLYFTSKEDFENLGFEQVVYPSTYDIVVAYLHSNGSYVRFRRTPINKRSYTLWQKGGITTQLNEAIQKQIRELNESNWKHILETKEEEYTDGPGDNNLPYG